MTGRRPALSRALLAALLAVSLSAVAMQAPAQSAEPIKTSRSVSSSTQVSSVSDPVTARKAVTPRPRTGYSANLLGAAAIFSDVLTHRAASTSTSTSTSTGKYTISGTVYDGNVGVAPAGSVTVMASRSLHAAIGSAGKAAIDTSGRYTISGLANGTYYLYFDYTGSGGYFSTWYHDFSNVTVPDQNVWIDGANLTGEDESLTLGSNITGHVTLGSAGVPVPAGDVSVSIASLGGIADPFAHPVVEQAVDASGNYNVTNLPTGYYGLYFRYLGTGLYTSAYYSASGEVIFSQNSGAVLVQSSYVSTINVVMPDLVTVSGHIYLGTTSATAGAGEATITLGYVDPTDGTTVIPVPGVSGTTDAAGKYSIPDRLPIRYVITVDYSGAGAFQRHSTSDGTSANDSELDATLRPTYSVSGHVYLGNTTRSATAGEVRVTLSPATAFTTATGTALTDADGNYTIAGITQGYYAVAFHYVGSGQFADQTPDWDPCIIGGCSVGLSSNRVGLDATLIATNSVSGVVTADNGAHLAGVTVSALIVDPSSGDVTSEHDTTTSSTGAYSFSGLLDADYEIHFHKAGYADQAYSDESEFYYADDVDLTGEVDLTNIDAVLHASATISGSASLPDNSQTDSDVANRDVWVDVEVYDGGSHDWEPSGPDDYFVTGSKGHYRYTIPGLAPDHYKLLLVYSGQEASGTTESSELAITAGSSKVVNFSITLYPVLYYGDLVRSSSSSPIYLVDGDSNFIPVRSTDAALAMGLPAAIKTIPAAWLMPSTSNPITVSPTPLSGVVSCYGRDYLAGSGQLNWILPSLVAQVPVTTLTTDTCDELYANGPEITALPFLVSSSTRKIWELDSTGVIHVLNNVSSAPPLDLFNGLQPAGSAIETVANSFLASLPQGFVAPVPGELVRSSSSSQLYLADGDVQLVPVPAASLDVIRSMGLSGSAVTVPDAVIAGYPHAQPLAGSIFTCTGPGFAGEYIAGPTRYSPAGSLSPIGNAAVDVPVTPLTSWTCDSLPLGSNWTGGYYDQLLIKTTATSAVWFVDSAGVRHPIPSAADQTALTAPYSTPVYTVATSWFNGLTVGPDDALAPGEIATEAGTNQLYLASGLEGLVPIQAADVATAMGLPGTVVTVSAATIAARTIQGSGALSSIVHCENADWIAGSGALWGIPSALVVSLPVSNLDDSVCGVAGHHGIKDFSHGIYVRSAQNSTIWYIDGSGIRHSVPSIAEVTLLSAPGPSTVLTIADSFIQSLPLGMAYPAPGQLVRSSTGSATYLVDGTRGLIPVADPMGIVEMGLSNAIVGSSSVTLTGRTASTLPLSIIVSCAGSYYVAGSGKLWKLAAGVVPRIHATVLDPSTCAAAPAGPAIITGGLLLKAPGSPTVWYIDASGDRDEVHSEATIQEHSSPGVPAVLEVSAKFIDSLPQGSDILAAGQVVKTSSGSTLYVLDGDGAALPVDSPDTLVDLGLSSVAVTVSPLAVAHRGGTLTNLDSCAGTDFIAGSGKLWPISADAAGAHVTDLAPSLCAVLVKSSTQLNPAIVRSDETGLFYTLSRGGKILLSGSRPAAYPSVSETFLESLPTVR